MMIQLKQGKFVELFQYILSTFFLILEDCLKNLKDEQVKEGKRHNIILCMLGIFL